MRIWTVGHGTRAIDAFLDVLKDAGVTTLADIRRYPGSRRHPQFGQAVLRGSSADAGISYLHLPGLGGRRRPRADSPHTALRIDAFRGYADHMSSDGFRRDLATLEELARAAPAAYLCAETHWSRCHRRMLSDLLTVRGWTVTHLIDAGRSEPHHLWDVARVVDGALVYDGGAVPLRPR